MRVECVHCGKQYSLQDESAGAYFKCRRCGKLVPIAALSGSLIEGTATDHAQNDALAQTRFARPTYFSDNA